MVTSLDFPITIGADVLLVRLKSDKISVTPTVPFLTLTEPSEQLPVRIYVPDSEIVTAVPSIFTLSVSVLISLSEKVRVTASDVFSDLFSDASAELKFVSDSVLCDDAALLETSELLCAAVSVVHPTSDAANASAKIMVICRFILSLLLF